MKRFVPLVLSGLLLAGCASAAQNGTGSDNESIEQSTESSFAQAVEQGMSNEEPPEFLSDENKELFKRAEYIYYNAFVCSGFNFTIDDSRKTTDFEGSSDYGYAYETDYDYSELEDYVESVFTGDALEQINGGLSSYVKDSSGKLCWIDAARGTDIFYNDKTFELVSESDDKIEFKAVANYSWKEMYATEEEFKESGTEGDYEWTEEYNFELTKTDDGWRVSRFEYWK